MSYILIEMCSLEGGIERCFKANTTWRYIYLDMELHRGMENIQRLYYIEVYEDSYRRSLDRGDP